MSGGPRAWKLRQPGVWDRRVSHPDPGLAREGHVDGKGLPNLIQLALTAQEFSDVVALRSHRRACSASCSVRWDRSRDGADTARPTRASRARHSRRGRWAPRPQGESPAGDPGHGPGACAQLKRTVVDAETPAQSVVELGPAVVIQRLAERSGGSDAGQEPRPQVLEV